jgi:hypothetical protein
VLAVSATRLDNGWLQGATQPQALLLQPQQLRVTTISHAGAGCSSSSRSSKSSWLTEQEQQQDQQQQQQQGWAWRATPTHQQLSTRNKRTLQQQQQQQQIDQLTVPQVSYAYSTHDSTDLTQLVPGFDTHGMRLTRFVVTAWSISNFSSPEILTNGTVQTVQQLIVAYLNVSSEQVSESAAMHCSPYGDCQTGGENDRTSPRFYCCSRNVQHQHWQCC